MTLHQIVGSKNRVKVLRELFRRDAQSGREIARRADISPSAGKTSLEELAQAGLVHQVRDRGRLSHTLNRSYFLTRELDRLFTEEARMPGSVADDVRRHLRTLEVATELLGLGISETGTVTLATSPRLEPGTAAIAVLTRRLHSRFGLHLDECVASPAAIPARQRLWTPPGPRESFPRVSPREQQQALRFFGIDDGPGQDGEPGSGGP